MLKTIQNDRKQEQWIREQTKVEDILATIKEKNWDWAGYVMRKADNRWTVKVTEW